MADSSLGVAVLRTRLDTSGLRTGLSQAKGETQRFANDSASAIRGIGAAFGAVVASQGVRSYISFLTSSANLAHQADAAHRLYEKSLQRTNQSTAEGAALVDRLSSRFGVANSVIEDAATLMLRQGASLSDVERALTAAGASAAAAGFDISTAFNNVSTAVATGRIELLETSGIVANLGPVAQQYARSVGKTVEQLTQQELVQARVNAIYEETKSEIEDVDEILQGLPLSQARVTQEWRDFREGVGGIAQEVVVPLTDALGAVLGYVNDLPEPVRRAGLAMSGAAIGATTLATGIVAIRAALQGLSTAGLLSFGPAGWIVLGVTAVAGLVAVLAGQGRNGVSLEDAISRVKVAASDTTALEGFDDTITTLADNLSGPVKRAFEGARDDIEAIVTSAESAREALTRISLGTNLAQELQNDFVLRGTVEGVIDTRGAEFNQAGRLRQALLRGEFAQAAVVIEELIGSFTAIGDSNAVTELTAFLNEVRRAEEEVQSLLTGRSTPTPPPRRPPPQPTAAGDGAESVLGDPAEEAKAWVTRLEAELRFGLKGPGDVIGILTPRVEQLRDEATTALAEFGIDSTQYADTVAKLDVIEGALARIREPGAIQLSLSPSAQVAASVPLGITPTASADLSGLRSVNDIERDLSAARAAVRAAATTEARAEAQSVVLMLEEELRRVTRGVSLAIEPIAEVLGEARGLAITPTASVGQAVPLGITPTAEVGDFTSIESLEADLRRARDAVRTAASAEARHEAQLVVMEIERELERLRSSVTPRALGITPVASVGSPRGLGIDPVAQIDGMDPTEWVRAQERAAEEQQRAADQFASTVVSAGFAMGDAAIRAIQDGDIPGLLKAGLSGAGSILGAAQFDPISLFGGMINPGVLIAGGLGLLGTLLGALLGGGRRDVDESRRAAGAAVQSAPAIDLRVIINQSLNVQSLTDPASRRAVDGLLDDMVRRVEDTLKRNVLPRLDALEGAA